MVKGVTHPTILAFDTSVAHCAAAILHHGQVTARTDEMSKGQAEHLMPMLEDMLSDAGLNWSNLDGIGVGIGPGNFTGIRISVAAARGLALGLGKKAIGVSALDALSFDLPNVMTCLKAPRGRAYVQYNGIAALCEITKDDLPQLHPKSEISVVGDAAEEIAEVLGIPVLRPRYSVIEAIARIAATGLNFPAKSPAPLYLRDADAAPPRDAPPVILP